MPNTTKAGYIPPKAEKPKPQQPAKPGKKKKKRKQLSGAVIASLVILLIAVLIGAGTIWVYTVTSPYNGAFLPGTYLSGRHLSGAPREAADVLLNEMTGEAAQNWTFELVWQGESYTLTAQDVGLAVDAAATIDPLWQQGREGGMLGRLAAMIRLSAEPVYAEPVVVYSMDAADALLAGVKEIIDCEPVDAQMTFTPGSSEPFAYTEDSSGLVLDTAPIREEIEAALASMTSGRIVLEPEKIAPQVTREALEEASVLRAYVKMNIQADDAAAANIALAAEKLSGAAVMPGESLSFNKTVGARTAQAGYLEAEEEAYGRGAVGVGGGVCAVSTALYRAALLAQLPVAQRSAAVRPVSYCEMGQEAAVSGQGLDLLIENDTKTPVFIMTRTYPSPEEGTKGVVVEVNLIGAPLAGMRKLETQALETGVIDEPIYVRDQDGTYATYTDEKVPVGEGEPGYSALVELVSFDEAGKETGRKTVSEDNYDPLPPTIYVGAQKRN